MAVTLAPGVNPNIAQGCPNPPPCDTCQVTPLKKKGDNKKQAQDSGGQVALLKMKAELTKTSQQFYDSVSGSKSIYAKVKNKIEATDKQDLQQLTMDVPTVMQSLEDSLLNPLRSLVAEAPKLHLSAVAQKQLEFAALQDKAAECQNPATELFNAIEFLEGLSKAAQRKQGLNRDYMKNKVAGLMVGGGYGKKVADRIAKEVQAISLGEQVFSEDRISRSGHPLAAPPPPPKFVIRENVLATRAPNLYSPRHALMW